MHFWYLPTVDYPLWPCVGLALLVFIPVTIWHERAWRRTLAEYGAARSAAGAVDPWPPEGMSALLGVQPWLLLTAAALLAVMTGTRACRAAGVAAQAAVLRRAAELLRPPLRRGDGGRGDGGGGWRRRRSASTSRARRGRGVAQRALRRSTHAAPERHATLMNAALGADPGVEQARSARSRRLDPQDACAAWRSPCPSGRPPRRSW